MSSQASNPEDFGNSWVVNVDQCDDVRPEPPNPCVDNSITTEEAESLCNILLNDDGNLPLSLNTCVFKLFLHVIGHSCEEKILLII